MSGGKGRKCGVMETEMKCIWCMCVLSGKSLVHTTAIRGNGNTG